MPKQANIPQPTSDLFSAVTSTRMSGAIVDQVRELIRTERLQPGDRLPSERAMGERMRVSRVTIREAFRVLEAGGFIEIRVGAHGGAFVTSPSSSRLGADLADLINLSPLTAGDVTEARQVVELGIIPLVVERATRDDIAELRAMVKEHQVALTQGRYGMPLSAAFHAQVAACTHNGAIEMLVRSFHGPLLMSLREAQVAAPLMGRRGTQEHADFVDAIAERDVERATEIMTAHLARTRHRVARVKASRSDAATGRGIADST